MFQVTMKWFNSRLHSETLTQLLDGLSQDIRMDE